MRSILKSIFRKFFIRSGKKTVDERIKIGEGSHTNGLNLMTRMKTSLINPVIIGNDSMVSGEFIFEKESGSIKIGDRCFIGGGRYVTINSIEIGNDVMISWGCTLMDNNAHSLKWEERQNDVLDWKRGIEEGKVGKYKDWNSVESDPILIKDKVWIGFNVIILKGVTIGEGAVVAAGSVVTKDVSSYTVVAGNPAEFKKDLR